MIDELFKDAGNTLFGLQLGQLKKIIGDYQQKGVDPYELVRVRQELQATKQTLNDLYDATIRSGYMFMGFGQPWEP